METKIYHITDPEEDFDKIAEAAEVLKNGGLVAFPTDTVYAVGAAISQYDAIERLFEVKNRPKDNPMSVLVARDLDIHMVADFTAPNSAAVANFIEMFWPGPLTIVMKRLDYRVLGIITGGSQKIGVRMPDNAIAQALINEVENPVVAPSANISGHPSPTTGQHVIDELNGKVDMILVGPDCKLGIESTIVDLSDDHPVILRKGPLTRDQLQEACPRKIIELSEEEMERLRNPERKESQSLEDMAPGLKYKHYQPKTPFILYTGAPEAVKGAIRAAEKKMTKEGKKVGIIDFDGDETLAANLFYKELRKLDEEGLDMILGAGLPEIGLGGAVMDRMRKATGDSVVNVDRT